MPTDSLSTYLQAISKNLARGNATEHTHRPALKTLLESLDADVTATNEPQHIVDVGAPDFIVERKKIPLGYVETKDTGENLDKIEKSEQMKRYRAALPNLILTDYLEFRWYVDGERRETARLGDWDGKKIKSQSVIARSGATKQSPSRALEIASHTSLAMTPVAALLQKFVAQTAPTISKPKDLAERIAALAQLMRGVIEQTFARESERGNLHEWYAAFQETLIPDLTPAQFADMFAQTIAYGLFAARANDPTPENFSRAEAAQVLPKTNPFLRKLFYQIAGPDLDERIAWIADDLANLLARADMEKVLKDFGKRTKREDPVVHFYETFLASYDAKLRKARGVFYTPEPAVSYIVRSVDHLLRQAFGKANGLADSSVLLLDPAVGTATFLYFVIQMIYETLVAQGQKGAWANYVAEKLLPRLFGFEILMAPYTVAHLKLGIELKELGYDFASDQRLGIYLTNTLEQAAKQSERLLAKFISDESDAAASVKRDKPIMVVLGNPPYSNFGMMNKGEWIGKLLEDYKKGLHEKKLNLDDDFIKFIRFGQWRIDRSGAGILAFITSNTYIDGITHRRMRQSLLETFDDIYILDLHGSSKKKEKAPDGSKDENVFDIQQGVAIVLAVKAERGRHFERSEKSASADSRFLAAQDAARNDKPLARVHHAELWGARESKYAALSESDVATTKWTDIEPKPEQFFFVPKNFDLAEYNDFPKITDAFPERNTGIQTKRDGLVYRFNQDEILSVVNDFRTLDSETLRKKYELPPDGRDWTVTYAMKDVKHNNGVIVQVLYHPFDKRWTSYTGKTKGFMAYPRFPLMGNAMKQNLLLLTVRNARRGNVDSFFVADSIVDKDGVSPFDNVTFFPLYLYDAPDTNQLAMNLGTCRANLAPAFIADVEARLGLKFAAGDVGATLRGRPDAQTGQPHRAAPTTFTPEDIFHYAYAVFHSPTYRQRYAEFLKIDFPRLPLTRDVKLFRALAALGAQLVALHLMESLALDKLITRFPVAGSNAVEKVSYAEEYKDASGKSHKGCVFINKAQFFEGVAADVWNFHIGGYQVLDKWLKDRKGRALSYDDITHYQKIVVALKETMRLMNEIDAAIPKWPLE